MRGLSRGLFGSVRLGSAAASLDGTEGRTAADRANQFGLQCQVTGTEVAVVRSSCRAELGAGLAVVRRSARAWLWVYAVTDLFGSSSGWRGPLGVGPEAAQRWLQVAAAVRRCCDQ
ncbi:hypothetical protein EUGRSUZ_L00851 [Eucalyptus grandis]|uniref:Uncharacterized protein n=1 Tax=Eucalyptus grandis TaxID=71139 RepID=A0A058ZWS0_EUCGR|nr:hypothetical protein EUGRSUZ_L00851 [Eucalyptus grandis]